MHNFKNVSSWNISVQLALAKQAFTWMLMPATTKKTPIEMMEVGFTQAAPYFSSFDHS